MKILLRLFSVAALLLSGCAMAAPAANEAYFNQRSSDNTKNNPVTIQATAPSLLGFDENSALNKILIGPGLSFDNGSNTLSSSGSSSVLTSVESLAALRAVNTSGFTTGTLARVTGHTVALDGGGGEFYWLSAVTYADDNGMVVAPNGGGTGRWLRMWAGELNIRWFGARGNNSNDDTAEIQAVFDWLENNQVIYLPTLGTQGAIYFPRGVYLISSPINIDFAYGMKIRGDGMMNTAIRMNTTTLTALNVTSYIAFSLSDITIDNSNGTSFDSWMSQTTSIGLMLNSNGTATLANLTRVQFMNWVHCVYQGGTLSGDSGYYEQVHFRRAKNGWYSRNPMSGIQKFDQCVFDLVSVGGINTQGNGMIQIDTANFVGDGSLVYAVPTPSEWGLASNWVFNNCKMEYVVGSMWFKLAATDASSAQYAAGNLVFTGCSYSGGDIGNVGPTDVILEMGGSQSMKWVGGNFAGTLKYWMSNTLAHGDIATYQTRATVVFEGATLAPLPTQVIIHDASPGSGAGQPTIIWRNCANLIDLEMGGNIGARGRETHTVVFNKYLNGSSGAYYETQPYLNEIDFHGLPVRIHSVIFWVNNITSMPAGTLTPSIYSDSGRVNLLGTVSFASTAIGKYSIPLVREPLFLTGGKLYLKYTTPTPEGATWGHWIVTYTCL
jgi:hypothetical protein